MFHVRLRSQAAMLAAGLSLVIWATPAAQTPVETPSSSSAALQHDIDAILSAPVLERGFWGALVKSVGRDETLYSRNANKLMMPASTMKVVTLAAAAEKLGWDYVYSTRVFTTGKIVDGVLQGDLIVVGSGDPSL